MTHPPFAARRPEWIAHRGASREAHENTIPAFAIALERGADAIELDVHATADGIVVVHHDPALSTTLAPEHRGRAIRDTDWATLRDIELSAGARIPTLADVLDLVAHHAYVYVEIKGARIEPLVIAAIGASRADCAVHSFEHESIVRVATLAPDLPRGILIEDRGIDIRGAMRHASARDVWPQWRLIDRDLVTCVHDAGGRVIAWTVNGPSDARQLADLGVDGVCSDDLRPLIASVA